MLYTCCIYVVYNWFTSFTAILNFIQIEETKVKKESFPSWVNIDENMNKRKILKKIPIIFYKEGLILL